MVVQVSIVVNAECESKIVSNDDALFQNVLLHLALFLKECRILHWIRLKLKILSCFGRWHNLCFTGHSPIQPLVKDSAKMRFRVLIWGKDSETELFKDSTDLESSKMMLRCLSPIIGTFCWNSFNIERNECHLATSISIFQVSTVWKLKAKSSPNSAHFAGITLILKETHQPSSLNSFQVKGKKIHWTCNLQ